MTRIIEFLIALGIVAALFVIVGVLLPSERHLSESVETNRRMTIVYDTLNSFRRFKDWNPLVLRDPRMELKLTGPESGVGARLEYDSDESQVGSGFWEITESVPGEKVVMKIEDDRRGKNKVTEFDLEPTGKNNRNVRITQSYSVEYGWDLLGRYAGLYVTRHVGDDIKLGLSRLTNMLATVPNYDYRAEGSTLTDMSIVDVPAENLLVVNAGNLDRNNEVIRKSIKDNQEWINRIMEANDLEAAGPVRIITTDFGAEKYAFDVAMPVRKKGSGGARGGDKAAADDAKADADAEAEKVETAAVDEGPLEVKIPSGAPVEYVRTEAHRSAFARYTGYMAELDAARNALRAWALTNGYEVVDRPYEKWLGGVDKSFTAEGEFEIYWAIK